MSLDQITPGGRIVEEQLDSYLELVKKQYSADALAFVGPMSPGADEALREAVEFIHGRDKGQPSGIKSGRS